VPFIRAKNFIAVKAETTSGTLSAPLAADFNIRIMEPTFEPEIEAFIMEFASGRHSKSAAVMGKKKAHAKFKVPMRTGAAAGTAPKMGKLWQACGQLETIIAVTSVAYTPLATKDYGDNISVTISMYLTPASGNSVILTMKGAMGNCIVTMDDLGQPMISDFDFLGCFVSIADGATIALTSPDTDVPPGTIGSIITSATIAQRVAKFKLDFGNTVELDIDPSDSTGYRAAYIAKREPKMSLDPRAELLATDPHYTQWAAGTEAAFSFTTPVGSAALKYVITAPKFQILGLKVADRNSAMIWDLDGELHENAGDDSHQILISA